MEAGTLEREQLSFEVGGNTPTASTLSVSGKLADDRDYRKGDTVSFTVEVLVTEVAFTDKVDKLTDQVVDTVRRHKGRVISFTPADD